MRILVTAGNTQAPIDRVRCITNIFTGRTGGRIAEVASKRGHLVTLLTSHPPPPSEEKTDPLGTLRIRPYQSYDDLTAMMKEAVTRGGLDAIIHSAAVSDYLVQGVYRNPADAAAVEGLDGKITSRHRELWIRLTPAPKLVDLIRGEWGFRGILVKFKLEVGVNEKKLLATAEESRQQSRADLLVANTLEARNDWALLGPLKGKYRKIERRALPAKLIEEVETLHQLKGGK